MKDFNKYLFLDNLKEDIKEEIKTLQDKKKHNQIECFALLLNT